MTTHEVSALKLPPARISRRPSPSPQKARITSGSSAPELGRRSGPRSFHFRTRAAKARADADVSCNNVNLRHGEGTRACTTFNGVMSAARSYSETGFGAGMNRPERVLSEYASFVPIRHADKHDSPTPAPTPRRHARAHAPTPTPRAHARPMRQTISASRKKKNVTSFMAQHFLNSGKNQQRIRAPNTRKECGVPYNIRFHDTDSSRGQTQFARVTRPRPRAPHPCAPGRPQASTTVLCCDF